MSDRYRLIALGNDALVAALSKLVRCENDLLSDLLAHLAELDERRLYLDLGFTSMFAYCTEALGLCRSSAYRRIAAARVCRRYPEVFARVAAGELQTSVLAALSRHLTHENSAELFAVCSRKSCEQVEELLAIRFPKPDVADSIRRLRPASSSMGIRNASVSSGPSLGVVTAVPGVLRAEQVTVGAPLQVASKAGPAARRADQVLVGAPSQGEVVADRSPLPIDQVIAGTPSQGAADAGPAALRADQMAVGAPSRGEVLADPPPLRIDQVIAGTPSHSAGNANRVAVPDTRTARVPCRLEPLSKDRFGVHFTANGEFKRLLEEVRALSSHRQPTGDLASVITRALEAYREQLLKTRYGVGRKARHSKRLSASPAEIGSGLVKRSRHVPVAIAREVYLRDGGGCTFCAANGQRCGARRFLELDHVTPWAELGEATVANLRLRCRAHNQHAARAHFGAEYVWARVAVRKQRKESDHSYARDATPKAGTDAR